ncbi:hypothetical protein Tco_1005832 [Tanacetum coccineum]|uniref:Uncharacterized protein n=1 Tax=Tanacetum coccineum TaxID=301880 RepID=A0ABQ5FH49_9ASTR
MKHRQLCEEIFTLPSARPGLVHCTASVQQLKSCFLFIAPIKLDTFLLLPLVPSISDGAKSIVVPSATGGNRHSEILEQLAHLQSFPLGLVSSWLW